MRINKKIGAGIIAGIDNIGMQGLLLILLSKTEVYGLLLVLTSIDRGSGLIAGIDQQKQRSMHGFFYNNQ